MFTGALVHTVSLNFTHLDIIQYSSVCVNKLSLFFQAFFFIFQHSSTISHSNMLSASDRKSSVQTTAVFHHQNSFDRCIDPFFRYPLCLVSPKQCLICFFIMLRAEKIVSCLNCSDSTLTLTSGKAPYSCHRQRIRNDHTFKSHCISNVFVYLR